MQKLLNGIRQFFNFASLQQAAVIATPDIKGGLIELEQMQRRVAHQQ